MTWLLFLLTAVVIVAAGTQLARYGDVLAEKTGMGQTWIGLVLLAATTSLPELFVGASASAIYRLPDIAVGDVLGSCMFNLLILSLLDLFGGRVPISTRASQGHALSIGFGLLLIGLVGAGLLTGGIVPGLGWIGFYTPVLILVYLLAMRLVFVHERRRLAREASQVARELRYARLRLAAAVRRYTASAVVVVAGALLLPGLGERLAHETGLGGALVGNLFIALSTSLPEVVVALSAVRMGAVDLAVANVLGSNLFDVLILAVDDLLYLPGPILAAAHKSQQIVVLAVVLMYAVLLVGLSYQALHKRLVLAWDTVGILVVYLATTVLLFAMRS